MEIFRILSRKIDPQSSVDDWINDSCVMCWVKGHQVNKIESLEPDCTENIVFT